MSKLYWSILHEAFDSADNEWNVVNIEDVLKDKISEKAYKVFDDCLNSNFSQLYTNDEGKYMYGDWYDDYVFDSLADLIKDLEYNADVNALNEDFWNPSEIFDKFIDFEEDRFSDSDWNKWSDSQRTLAVTKVMKAFIDTYGDKYNSEDYKVLLDDFTDNNFHTENRVLRKLINNGYLVLEESIEKPVDESINLSESLKQIDNKCFDIYCESYELEQLYESNKTNLTAQQRSELKNVASHARTAEEVYDTLSGMINRQKNETLQEGSYISSNSIDSKLTDVKMMHEAMLSMNDENAYMSWIYTMPDQPTEEDFEYFAEDRENYDDLKETFDRLYDKYKKWGLYKPSTEVIEWLKGAGYEVYDTKGNILESCERTKTDEIIETLTEDTAGENEVNFRDRAINGDLYDFDPQDFMNKVMKSGVSMNTRRYFNGKVYVIDVFYDGFTGKKGIDNPDTMYWIDIVSIDESNNQDRIPPSSRKTMNAEDVVKTLQDWKDSMLSGNNLDAEFNDTEFENETEIE